MSNPDDGGPAYPQLDRAENYKHCNSAEDEPQVYYVQTGGMSLRARLAMQFAAAWLPLILPETKGGRFEAAGERSNELGLAMADDLLRRLRENT